MRNPIQRPMLHHEVVFDARRARVTNAYAELCLEGGYPQTTVAHIVARTGIARTSFYEVFSGREDAFIALVGRASAELLAVLTTASGDTSADRVQAALRAALDWLAGHEAFASVLLVDAPTGPPAAWRAQVDLYDAIAVRLAHALHGAQAAATAHERMIIGGVASVIRNRLLANELNRAPELAEELSSLFRRRDELEAGI